MRGALNYNEQKVLDGKAKCIVANMFKAEASLLSFKDKLNRFQELNDRNQRTSTNTLHISLNFDMTEKLSVDQLTRIAASYMEKIGFSEQPYLVYEHFDAAHPHIHILTTLIQQDGKRIPIHYLGKNQSEKARKEIEIEFQLAQASGKSKNTIPDLRPIDIEKVIYGKSESRRSISNVVRTVTRTYKYASVPELNAVLGLYNIKAERGAENSRMFQQKGLLYTITDTKGNSIGIPVKASAIYGKPTMQFLEKQFKVNEILRQPHKHSVKAAIDRVLSSGVKDKNELIAELRAGGIAAIFRSNADGRVYGVTFVDTNRHVVFKGSELGKAYSVNSLLSRLSANINTAMPFRPGFSPPSPIDPKDSNQSSSASKVSEILIGLAGAEDFDKSSPEAALRLGRKKRKRKSRGI